MQLIIMLLVLLGAGAVSAQELMSSDIYTECQQFSECQLNCLDVAFAKAAYRIVAQGDPPPTHKISWCEKNNRKHGPYIEWDSEGNKKMAGYYSDGVKEGKWFEYNVQVTYFGGKKDGPWLMWSDDGILITEGAYSDDLESGKWLYWTENGTKQQELICNKGKPNGLVVFWHDTGIKRQYGEFYDEKPCGVFWCWDEEGVPISCQLEQETCVLTDFGAECSDCMSDPLEPVLEHGAFENRDFNFSEKMPLNELTNSPQRPRDKESVKMENQER